MALSATVFKVELAVSDVDRAYYHTHNLTIARHPSENDKRMMIRILAFALHAQEGLEMTKGLSTDDEPDIWCRTLSNEIELWVELGQPDVKRLRRVSGRSKQVAVYCYNDNSTNVWWDKSKSVLQALKNLSVFTLTDHSVDALANLVSRSMSLQCTVNDGDIWFSNGEDSIQLDRVQLK